VVAREGELASVVLAFRYSMEQRHLRRGPGASVRPSWAECAPVALAPCALDPAPRTV